MGDAFGAVAGLPEVVRRVVPPRCAVTFAARPAEAFLVGALVFFADAFARFVDDARTAFLAVRAVFTRVLVVLAGALFLPRLDLAFFMVGGVGLPRVVVVPRMRR